MSLTILPDGLTVAVAPGVSVLEACRDHGIHLPGICGGRGRCRECRVTVVGRDVAPSALDRSLLEPGDLAKGWRLSCQLTVDGDLTVELPPVSLKLLDPKVVLPQLAAVEPVIQDVDRGPVRRFGRKRSPGDRPARRRAARERHPAAPRHHPRPARARSGAGAAGDRAALPRCTTARCSPSGRAPLRPCTAWRWTSAPAPCRSRCSTSPRSPCSRSRRSATRRAPTAATSCHASPSRWRRRRTSSSCTARSSGA